MNSWVVFSIGFLAQLLFGARLIFQWVLSEKNKKVMTPATFWWLSLLASFLLFIYGYLRDDFAIMLGQTLTYFIYIRNLYLQGQWNKTPKIAQWILGLIPVLIVFYAYNNNVYDSINLFENANIPLWLILLGSIAQIIFTFRFIYQWIYSEKNKKSTLPFGFWLLSLAGSILILVYAILRNDPVLLIGHSIGCIIYIRNLVLLRNEKPIHEN